MWIGAAGIHRVDAGGRIDARKDGGVSVGQRGPDRVCVGSAVVYWLVEVVAGAVFRHKKGSFPQKGWADKSSWQRLFSAPFLALSAVFIVGRRRVYMREDFCQKYFFKKTEKSY